MRREGWMTKWGSGEEKGEVRQAESNSEEEEGK